MTQANYYKAGKKHYLEIGEAGRGKVHEVSGKREARTLAKKLGATPYNF